MGVVRSPFTTEDKEEERDGRGTGGLTTGHLKIRHGHPTRKSSHEILQVLDHSLRLRTRGRVSVTQSKKVGSSHQNQHVQVP